MATGGGGVKVRAVYTVSAVTAFVWKERFPKDHSILFWLLTLLCLSVGGETSVFRPLLSERGSGCRSKPSLCYGTAGMQLLRGCLCEARRVTAEAWGCLGSRDLLILSFYFVSARDSDVMLGKTRSPRPQDCLTPSHGHRLPLTLMLIAADTFLFLSQRQDLGLGLLNAGQMLRG